LIGYAAHHSVPWLLAATVTSTHIWFFDPAGSCIQGLAFSILPAKTSTSRKSAESLFLLRHSSLTTRNSSPVTTVRWTWELRAACCCRIEFTLNPKARIADSTSPRLFGRRQPALFLLALFDAAGLRRRSPTFLVE